MVCVRRGMVGFMVCQGSSATAITSSLLSIIRTGGLSHLVPFLLRRATERQSTLHSGLHRPVLLRRTKVARRHGVPRPRLLPLLLHGALPQLGPSSTSSLIGGIGGTRARRRHKAPTPAAEAAGVRVVLLGLRARQTGATIGSILIGSGRTRGAPPRFEVCDVSIIMMSVDSALGRGRAREGGSDRCVSRKGTQVNLVSIHVRCFVIRPS